MKIIFGFLIILFFTSCLAGMPVMNNSIPAEGTKEKITVSGGIGKITTNSQKRFSDKEGNGEITYFPIIYGGFKRKIDDVFSFEIFTPGVKLIEDIYKGNSIYIAAFQSIYLLGANFGAVIATINQNINFYLSTRMDYTIVFVPVMGSNEGKYLNNTSSAGINFNYKKQIMFVEFVFSLPVKTYEKRKERVEDETTITTDRFLSESSFTIQTGITF